MNSTNLILWLIIVSAIISIFFLVRRRERLKAQASPASPLPPLNEPIPDTPISFGYKCSWYCVRGLDDQRIVEIISPRHVASANWREGIEAAYKGEVFITPKVDQWKFIISTQFFMKPLNEISSSVSSHLSKFSHEGEPAFFFATDRVTETHIWAKAVGGSITRGYGYCGESGEVFWDEGEPSSSEKDLLTYPDEETILKLANDWVISPLALDKYEVRPAIGILVEI
jgi:hypothetical protein